MPQKIKYKRILLKLSGEVLEGELDGGIDFKFLDTLCKEIAEVHKLGVQIAIVVGGGNFWRFRDFAKSGLDRVHSDSMGMLATVMNALALAHAFNAYKIEALPFSAIPMEKICPTYVRDLALAQMKKGKIAICAAGTGSPFFTTDTAAALRALELQCDVLLKATNVDYVYNKDPHKYKDAKKFTDVSYEVVLEKQLGVMDLSATALCASSRLPVLVFNLLKRGNILKAVKGETLGTLIH